MVGQSPEGMDEYLKPTPLCDSDNEEIKKKARELIKGVTGPKEATLSIFYFVRDEIKYALDFVDVKASHTLKTRLGTCEHKSKLQIALLRDLCNGMEQPEYKFGRPRLPLADVVFGAVYKVYSTMSSRRFMTNLREAEAKGLVSKSPSLTSGFRSFENPELIPLLKALIEQSASPLRAIETDFAVDSSGFSTTTYARWFDHKWGKERSKQTWVKTHVMCGVKTHVVTSVEATLYESSDNHQFILLINKTAETFDINEVSADKAYTDRRNLHAVQVMAGWPTFLSKSIPLAWETIIIGLMVSGTECGISTTTIGMRSWCTITSGLM